MGMLDRFKNDKMIMLIALLLIGIVFAKWVVLIAIVGVILIFILDKTGIKRQNRE